MKSVAHPVSWACAALALAAAVAFAPPPIAGAPAAWPTPPPVPKPRPVTDDYAGTKVVDAYRYFENMSDPLVVKFFRDQNAYARAVLEKLEPGRGALLARIANLDNATASVTSVQRAGAYDFYERRDPQQNSFKLYVRHEGESDERVLVDPDNLVTKAGQHFTIEYFSPSPNGDYVAYGVSEGGSENATLHVVEVAGGRILSDAIDRAKYIGVTGWRSDDKSFYYLRFPKLAAGEPPTDAELKPISYLHVLGNDPDRDPAVFGYGLDPAVALDPTDFPLVITSPVSRYAIGLVAHGVKNEQTLYVAPAADLAKRPIGWKKIADVADDVTSEDIRGSWLYLLSHRDASNYKVLALDLERPDIAQARTIVAPSKAVVEEIGVAGDGLYVRSRLGGFGAIERAGLAADGTPDGQTRAIGLPLQGAVDEMITDPRVNGAIVHLVSWTTSRRYLEIDANGQVSDTGLQPLSTVDTTPYASEEAFAPSADGTQVPISIIYRKDLARDGSHPTYLEGYGAYGITIDPYFLGTRFAWLDRGGVWAVCHVRGGGWFGEDWHRAGMIATKQHTIDDFIGCGRYLVTQKFTTPQHLAGEGTSAGGITIGRAITEKPALFAAALDVVGESDAVRGEFTPNGPPNVPEFGTVKDPADVAPLINMDAYLNVKSGTPYPAVMLITGINDPRVAPWELAKFAAALERATTSGRPILLRVDYDAGHGFLDATRAQSEQLLADQFSFLLWQLRGSDVCPGPAAHRLLPLTGGSPKFARRDQKHPGYVVDVGRRRRFGTLAAGSPRTLGEPGRRCRSSRRTICVRPSSRSSARRGRSARCARSSVASASSGSRSKA
jgi:prolyl oligopeptidase